MSVITYKKDTQITKHFNSKEFKCPETKETKISTKLINKAEELFSIINARKCIVSSGYRSYNYDIKMNGFAGKHSEGLAMDCCYYDKDNKPIPSKIICCLAYELGFTGIAKITDYYVHLDIRTKGIYYGDETRGNSSYWTNPYKYFNVTIDELNKYTLIKDTIKYQAYTNKWLPNVIKGTEEYAGIFGKNISRVYIDKLKYRVKSKNKWLPEVTARNDYAGYSDNSPITGIAIKGAVYRVHIKNGNWLPWVTGYNINDYNNGYAGNGKEIDAIQIK